MRRPADLFDREHEWKALTAFADEPGSGIRLALLWGRRRQGKSYLLRRLVQGAGGLYHQALEEERRPSLDSFGVSLAEHLSVPGGRLQFDDWSGAFAALGELPSGRRPAVVVIDEFPYLLAHSPELPSVIQRVIDQARHDGPPLRLVLCGSALATMATLLSGTKALRGRATHDVVLRAFDYRQAAEFWKLESPSVAFLVDAVLGGTPGYKDLMAGRTPRRPADLLGWLAAGPLDPASALFREDDYLLTEERSFSDRALYHSVVGAIARGNTTQGTIAAALGREQGAVQHPLGALERAGFVDRQADVLRARRPIYRLVDPIVRFHHVVTRRDLARFEERRAAEAWEDGQHRFAAHVLGPHFEHLAREFTFRFASSTTTGGPVSTVGPAVLNDRQGRSQMQLDVVAVGAGANEVRAIGEAKHTASRRTLSDLQRLERARELLVAAGHASAAARLLLFSANGFDANLREAARRRDDAELIDLQRLYSGE